MRPKFLSLFSSSLLFKKSYLVVRLSLELVEVFLVLWSSYFTANATARLRENLNEAQRA